MGMNRGGGGGFADRLQGARRTMEMQGRGTRYQPGRQLPGRGGPMGPRGPVAPQGALQNMYSQAQAQAGGAPPPQGGGMPGRVMANQRAMAQQMRGGAKPTPNPTGNRAPMGGRGYGGGRRGPMRMGRGDMYR